MEQLSRIRHSTEYFNPADKSRQLNCGAGKVFFFFYFLFFFIFFIPLFFFFILTRSSSHSSTSVLSAAAGNTRPQTQFDFLLIALDCSLTHTHRLFHISLFCKPNFTADVLWLIQLIFFLLLTTNQLPLSIDSLFNRFSS